MNNISKKGADVPKIISSESLTICRTVDAPRERVWDKEVLGVSEAARYLGISRSSVYNLIYSGEIVSFKVGGRRLIMREELLRYLGSLQEEAIERARGRAY